MIKCTFIILSFVLLSVAASAQQTIPANAEAFYEKAMAQINHKHVSWIKQTAKEVNKNNQDESVINAKATDYGKLSGLGNQYIMALAFIVMMEASKCASEDLKAIMDGVKAINKEKEGWRKVSNSALRDLQ
jgi:hypothetical protein